MPVLEGLGARHAGYGVRESHYGAALLETLRQRLADDFTAPVRDAWVQVYGLVRHVMLDAARRQGEVVETAGA